MAYGESNAHVTDDDISHVTTKGQTHDSNTLRAQYLENSYLATIVNY